MPVWNMDTKSNIVLCVTIILFVVFSCCHSTNAEGSSDFHEPKYRNCADSYFCARLRANKPDKSPYHLLTDSVNVTSHEDLEGKIINVISQDVYLFKLQLLEYSTIRLIMHEETVYRKRFHPKIALKNQDPSPQKFVSIEKHQDRVIIDAKTVKIVITAVPVKVELYQKIANESKSEPTIVVNDLNRLIMEYNQREQGLIKYEETFDGHADSRPYGPMGVALDFSFPEAKRMYGLGIHMENYALQSTNNTEPYRLFNCDYSDQKLHDKRSMYGSIPFAIAHGVNNTAGIFWLNSADTWVDINELHGSSATGYNSYFMSETGLLDVFLMVGSNMYDVIEQYSALIGAPSLPPYWALGYHQSRWNYFSQKEVLEVAENFDKGQFPLDAVWLDIEYTDQKKYFTWDPVNFSNPKEMIDALVTRNRKLVVIIDPHIKQDLEYKVYNDGIQMGLFVKYSNGSTFIGTCWPNASAWFDYGNPKARDYWASLFSLEHFKGSTNDVFIWNDMNEPSVFEGPERTFQKDLVHFDGWEHRDIHNIYGLLQVTATHDGLLKRSKGQKRPFILTRSYFAGSQRYAAIWTGDNHATWDSFKMSIPTCLMAALGGISFCGADVGGFFNNPEPELLFRWYQAGAYLPFFRGHSEYHTARREPYLQDESVAKLIRKALQDRQIILPFYYTIFFHHTSKPRSVGVIRSLVMEFPDDEGTFSIDNQFLIGNALMVRPVTESKAVGAEVYFPGEGDVWYHLKCSTCEAEAYGKRFIHFQPDYNTTLVFVRGGHIVPKSADAEKAPLPSAKQVLDGDIALFIAPCKQDKAKGYLYLDEGDGFGYKENNSKHLEFKYDSKEIRMRFLDEYNFPVNQSVTAIQIGGKKSIQKAYILADDGKEIPLEVVSNPQETCQYIYGKKDQLSLNKEWTIKLQ